MTTEDKKRLQWTEAVEKRSSAHLMLRNLAELSECMANGLNYGDLQSKVSK